jgi:hypothetical protein
MREPAETGSRCVLGASDIRSPVNKLHYWHKASPRPCALTRFASVLDFHSDLRIRGGRSWRPQDVEEKHREDDDR